MYMITIVVYSSACRSESCAEKAEVYLAVELNDHVPINALVHEYQTASDVSVPQ